MQDPLRVEQYRVPVRPCGQPCPQPMLHCEQSVCVHATPPTLALQGWLSVEIAMPLHDPPLVGATQVGVVQERVCVPVRSQVLGCVCMHVPQAPHDAGPQAAPVGSAVQAWLSWVAVVAQVPAAHIEAVAVRVWVPVLPQVTPTEQSDHAVVVGAAQTIPSVVRVQSMDSLLSVGTHAPPPHAEVVTLRVWCPLVAHGSPPKSHAPNSPYCGAAHCTPSMLGRVQASVSIDGGCAAHVPLAHV